ncbi:MAG: NADH:flavin oxidoreductase [Parachlamydiales bacterium]|nr:NADH:flavin oxidoreductase [Parachlamydiales bacterium]
MSPLESLFKSSKIQLRNRVVMAPMTRNKSPGHVPNANNIAYYKKMAEGGVALVITEGTCVNHVASQGYPDVPNFFGEDALNGWKKVIEAVHGAGAKFFPQLWHVGSIRQSKDCNMPVADNPSGHCSAHKHIGIAPSAIPHPYIKGGEVPKEMDHEDIDATIKAFAEGAKDAQRIGCDGIEIHGAHGYLIDQFFWIRTNHREDGYGGKTLKERSRFAKEIVEGVRQAVGPDFPICFRLSQWKMGFYEDRIANTPEELNDLVTILSQAGVDIFHCSQRRFFDPEFPGSDLNLAGWVKKMTGKPTITVGSVGLDKDFVTGVDEACGACFPKEKLGYLNHCLKNGDYDLVAVGRALLADSQWPTKVFKSDYESILPFTPESLNRYP